MSETYYTASAAARQLGISRQRVTELAELRSIGQRPERGIWLFSEADLAALRDPALAGKPGRPRKPGEAGHHQRRAALEMKS